MVTLTIDGKYVVTDGAELKITKENPRLKTSDSYSLDVVLPMSAPENKAVFGNINRMDVAKRVATMTAVLVADNRTIIYGIAKVTGVTDDSVTVQIVGGSAGMGIKSDYNKTYIDEIDYIFPTHTVVTTSDDGTFPGCAGLYAYMPIADTNGNLRNIPMQIRTDGWDMAQSSGRMRYPAMQPNLLYVFQGVMSHCGYTIRTNALPSWCSHIYIASTVISTSVRSTLPHWTVQEFISEFEKFFGCAVVVDEALKVVDIISGNISNVTHTGYDVLDEYDTDITEEEEGNGKMGGNIAYALSGNDHETDCLSDEIKEAFSTREYETKIDLNADFATLTAQQKKQYFFHCPTGTYISVEGELFAVDQFGMLCRSQSDSSTSLKICPVAMAKRDFVINNRSLDPSEKVSATIFIPVLEYTGDKRKTFDPKDRISVDDESADGIEGVLFGDGELAGNKEEDKMQVFFVDDNHHHIRGTVGESETQSVLMMPQAFTDRQRSFDQNGEDNIEPWSFALRDTNAVYYIGQLQDRDYSVIDNAEIMLSFLCDGIPDITQVFVFRNKRYLCSKMELTITERDIAPVKVGYFYELL